MSCINIYLEERFIFYNGQYYSITFGDSFWERYLTVFDNVLVIARVKEVKNINDIPNGYSEISNKKISFYHLPYYHGPLDGLAKMPRLLFCLFKNVILSRYMLFRLPGTISLISGLYALILGKKYGVELIGDPYDVFSSGVGGKMSMILRYIFTSFTKLLSKHAIAISYVTKSIMQKRYPSNKGAFITHYSSISLPKYIFVDENIRYKFSNDMFNIFMVGSLEQRYKGFDIAIKAVSMLPFKDKVFLNIVGDGIYRKELETLSKDFGIDNNVKFYGKVANSEIFNLLKKMDLFLMPSRTEGLPRALIEAMAMGLPAIGSNVGGIPELLDEEWIFESENEEELSEKISDIYFMQDIYNISFYNMQKAKEYEDSILQSRRESLYLYLKNYGGD